MRDNVIKIRKKLERRLSEDRFEHTLGVAYTSVALAMRYGCDLEQAEIAGLLHDCAKQYDEETMEERCRRYNISITESEELNPALLHAKLGAFMAMQKYHVEDKAVISAILCHTTGKPEMSLLDKILYVADYIEPKRDKAPNLKEVRKMAFVDLDQALLKILEDTLNYLGDSPDEVDMMTKATYDFYKNQIQP